MAKYTKDQIKQAHTDEQSRLPAQVQKNNELMARQPAPEQVTGAQLSQQAGVKPQPTLKDAAQFNTAVDRNMNTATTDPNVNPTAKPVPELQPTPQPASTPKPRPAGS